MNSQNQNTDSQPQMTRTQQEKSSNSKGKKIFFSVLAAIIVIAAAGYLYLFMTKPTPNKKIMQVYKAKITNARWSWSTKQGSDTTTLKHEFNTSQSVLHTQLTRTKSGDNNYEAWQTKNRIYQNTNHSKTWYYDKSDSDVLKYSKNVSKGAFDFSLYPVRKYFKVSIAGLNSYKISYSGTSKEVWKHITDITYRDASDVKPSSPKMQIDMYVDRNGNLQSLHLNVSYKIEDKSYTTVFDLFDINKVGKLAVPEKIINNAKERNENDYVDTITMFGSALTGQSIHAINKAIEAAQNTDDDDSDSDYDYSDNDLDDSDSDSDDSENTDDDTTDDSDSDDSDYSNESDANDSDDTDDTGFDE